MRFIILFIALATSLGASVITDGSGYLPVVVQVFDKATDTPIEGAHIQLLGVKADIHQELDPKRQLTTIHNKIGKAITTSDTGIAVVFSHGKWSSFTKGDKSTYHFELTGTIVIKINGKEVFRQTLKDWAKQNNYTPQPNASPWVMVELPNR